MKGNNSFVSRHIGPSKGDLKDMLKEIGVDKVDSLIEETVPSKIFIEGELDLPDAMSEDSYLSHISKISRENQVFKSYIGLGYNDCFTPSVILRNIFENPSWYTQYTPYQAEISQGRLEALLNFQTMISDLTKMDIANASLLDEATAAAEAMTMFYRVRNGKKVKNTANCFFVSNECFPQTINLIQTRAEPLGIKVVIGTHNDFNLNESYFGAIVQYPDSNGRINDYSEFIRSAHELDVLVAVSADLLSLTILKPPGEFGADAVVGSSQRFGVPMGYGGPHAAFFATRDIYKRQVPGRIIGVSKDKNGKTAYRMSLQTREQHIRREKATSNICTAQSLLAIMAGMYAVYHGKEGLISIANTIHSLTKVLSMNFEKLGIKQINQHYFDTLLLDLSEFSYNTIEEIRQKALSERINFRYLNNRRISISLNETTTEKDIKKITKLFYKALSIKTDFIFNSLNGSKIIPPNLIRKSDFLKHLVFKSYYSETSMLRYIKSLELRDLSLSHSMIPLGSCTMKLNGTTEMIPVTWPEFSRLHPFCPVDQAKGYHKIINRLEKYLLEITGFDSCSLQPNSGAQGEYAGLLVIRNYLLDTGQSERNIVLVPSSAHGTNPASASMAGMEIVVVKCMENGDIDICDLEEKCKKHSGVLAAIMITYPSTHGVFETQITEICKTVHNYGGQVYMDGANLNAQVGLCKPGLIGADVCHINLHKTFSIPHGGGGPGMGPICVAKHLSEYLPGHPVVEEVNREKSNILISAAPWGSASILLISYGYIMLLGSRGVKEATKYAILNANYLKSRLEKYFTVLYEGLNGRVAHEFILDFRSLKKSLDIDVEDIAKRLMDFGFHAPTMSWPVPGTLMIEPTESESKEELDRFCEAMIEISREIKEVEEGKASLSNNLLKNSPHTIYDIVSDRWDFPYTREKACFPLEYLKQNKFWPSVSRIDNAYGDKNLICTCTSAEDYEEN
ncbi:MAG: aminomethyl-transferring glycine dehydrogenase [Thermodesulfobacteriota bacterium]